MKTIIRFPGESLPSSYYDVRYRVLREPLGSPKGSEKLEGDENAIHVWIEEDGNVVAVGRSHLLCIDKNINAAELDQDHALATFAPLHSEHEIMEDDSGMQIPTKGLTPAVQIRAMGTLQQYQDEGLATKVLTALEEESARLWNARSGWLQARIAAIPFYEANGWCCFGPDYEVPSVGPHVSMWKKF